MLPLMLPPTNSRRWCSARDGWSSAATMLFAAARNVVAKVAAVVPHYLRPFTTDPRLSPALDAATTPEIDTAALRNAGRDRSQPRLR